MPALIVPAALVVVVVMGLVFFWRLGREGRRRFEYWRGVFRIWKKNQRH